MKRKCSAQSVQSLFRKLAHNLASKLYIVDYNHIFLAAIDSARLFLGMLGEQARALNPASGCSAFHHLIMFEE